jgi:AhpD family alkylhydroperoxidase
MAKAGKAVKAAGKPAAVRSGAARRTGKTEETVADDAPVIALDLPPAGLSPAMQAYFQKCQDRLGFVPNVLLAYAFDMTKLEREMIAVAVSSQNSCYYCLTAHGAAVRHYSGNPLLGEHMAMNYRVARLSPRHRAMLDFAVKLTVAPAEIEEADRERLRHAGFPDRDIWDIAAVVGFFNMSNRVATATDMRPNAIYHGQAR